MNDVLKIETILGYVANDNHLRASRDGREFEGIIPDPTWTEELVKRDGTVTDTVAEMKKVILKYEWQTRKLAPLLKGRTTQETCRNIWNFLFKHIKYQEDDEGKEQLRSPALSWALRTVRGIDCDDFTLFAGCLMYNLNIPFYIRIARYKGKDYFQHVYPVIPLRTKQYITIDAVLDEYDAEKPPIETKDFLVMNTSNLNGIDISVLGSIEQEELNEVAGILSGEDFREVAELEGLGKLPTRAQELRAIHNHLLRTRRIVSRRPYLIKDAEHPKSFLGMVDYALKYWDTDKREEALGILAGEEDRVNDLEGLSGKPEGHEEVELFYGLNGLGSYDVLGKAKRQRKFFSKVKSAVKKAGQGIKKIAKALIKFNPLTATIRGAVLLALKVNLLKVSSKFKWGYLTEEEAKAKGFNMDEWRKLKKQLHAAENMYVKVLQGNASAFKKAMLSGRGGKLNGLEGLGYVATAAAAGATSTAVPFITKIINLLKKINYKKLIENVSALKLKGKKAKAEESEAPTEEGQSAMPEGGETSEGDPNVDVSQDAPPEESETTNGNADAEPKTPTGEKTESTPTETDSTEDSGSSNVPATTSNRAMTKTTDSGGAEESIITKAMNWVKANPTTSILLGAGAAFLIYKAVAPKARALSGVRRGRKKKGNAKKHPPKTVSGVPRKRKGKVKRVKL
jgi:hypothetical protein